MTRYTVRVLKTKFILQNNFPFCFIVNSPRLSFEFLIKINFCFYYQHFQFSVHNVLMKLNIETFVVNYRYASINVNSMAFIVSRTTSLY